MSEYENPKTIFLKNLLTIVREFEEVSGCEVFKIDFTRLDDSGCDGDQKTVIVRTDLELK